MEGCGSGRRTCVTANSPAPTSVSVEISGTTIATQVMGRFGGFTATGY